MSKRHSPASRIRLVAVGGKLCEHAVHIDGDEVGLSNCTPADGIASPDKQSARVGLAIEHTADRRDRELDLSREFDCRDASKLEKLLGLHGRKFTLNGISNQGKFSSGSIPSGKRSPDDADMADSGDQKQRSLLGQAVRTRRKKLGWNQTRLAEESGLSVASISRVETGDQGYTSESINNLATALGCSPGDLLDGVSGNSAKDELRTEIDRLTEADARRLLGILRVMHAPSDDVA